MDCLLDMEIKARCSGLNSQYNPDILPGFTEMNNRKTNSKIDNRYEQIVIKHYLLSAIPQTVLFDCK